MGGRRLSCSRARARVATATQSNVDASFAHGLRGRVERSHHDLDVGQATQRAAVVAEKMRVSPVFRRLFGRAKTPDAIARVVTCQEPDADEVVEVSKHACAVGEATKSLNHLRVA